MLQGVYCQPRGRCHPHPHRVGWRVELAKQSPTIHSVLPENYNPMLHHSMLEAANLDTTVVKEAMEGSRVRGPMPHTDFYDYPPSNRAPDVTGEELQRALQDRDELLQKLFGRDNSGLEIVDVLGIMEK